MGLLSIADHLPLLHFSLLAVLSTIRNSQINNYVPTPYLDEAFHIPQAQAYCRGDFHIWDPKLTTPPGLYLLSYPFAQIFGPDAACNVPALRAVNYVGGTFILPLIAYLIRQELFPGASARRDAKHTALNISLSPLLWFFGGLYYTDVWSVNFVLLGYLSSLKNRHWVAAGSLWASLWFRQTNFVWCCFIAGIAGVRVLKLGKNDPLIRNIRASSIIYLPLSIITSAVADPAPFLTILIPYILLPIASFVAFIVYNNFTIVLGDASAHVASLHLPQLLYFAAATAFFSWPLYISLLSSILLSITSWVLLIGAAGIVIIPLMLAAVRYNTILHPYLIADNRHYAFYIFRKLLLRYRGAKEAAVGVYYAAWVGIMGLLSISGGEEAVGEGRSKTNTAEMESKEGSGARLSWFLLWFICTAATLVTAPLVEPRYFITAWVLWRLQVSPSVEERVVETDALLWVESIWIILVNSGTLWMFLKRPFEWEHEKGVAQRFMW